MHDQGQSSIVFLPPSLACAQAFLPQDKLGLAPKARQRGGSGLKNRQAGPKPSTGLGFGSARPRPRLQPVTTIILVESELGSEHQSVRVSKQITARIDKSVIVLYARD